MQSNNPPYQPRTGLVARQAAAQQQQQFAHQKPIDLFDPNFVNQGGAGPGAPANNASGMDQLFGAQNFGGPSRAGGPANLGSAPDLSNMSDRDRRIFLRDQERANRNAGATSSANAAYGLAEPPPLQAPLGQQQPNLFGDAPVASNRSRDEIWQQKMAQRNAPAMQPPLPPGANTNLGLPPQAQGFTPATQINQQLNMVSAQGPTMQMPSPNRAHRKLKAVDASPLRQSNILTSAAAQQSPMRTSLTAQKLQQAQELDKNIQGGNFDHLSGGQPSQRHSVGLPPSGAKQGGGLMDALSGSEVNRRRAEQRAVQQNEYNQFLAQQKNSGPRGRSASGRQENGSALASGGMQMIGGYQMRQQEDKRAQQREYQQQLQEQMSQKQQPGLPEADKLTDQRKNQLSDQIFNDILRGQRKPQQEQPQQPAQPYPQLFGAQQQQPPMQPQQQAFLPEQPYVNNMPTSGGGLPPRVQSAGRRRQELERMQRQAPDVDPFHKNRQDENDAKKRELEKKREYGQMLQAQMAQKKQGRQSSLPPPDQLFEQPPQQPVQQIGAMPPMPAPQNNYPSGQVVDFGQFNQAAPVQPPQPGYQPSFQQPASLQEGRPKYSLDQQVSFDMNPAQLPPRGPAQFQHPTANAETNQNTQAVQQQQRSRQDEYRRQLEEQIKHDQEKKKRMKEEQERYERQNDKDMAQFMGLEPSAAQKKVQQQQVPPPNIPGPNAIGAPQVPQDNQPAAIRVGTDITKPQPDVDTAKQQARLKYQEEIRQQMEEAKARKEAQKLKEKQLDDELERKIQADQQRLTEKEVEEIKREGGKAPEVRVAKKVDLSQFQTSEQNKAARQNNFMEPEAPKAPAAPSNDPFTKPESIVSQPLSMNVPPAPGAGDNKADLFGAQPPASMLPPAGPSAPGFGSGPPPPGGQPGFQPAIGLNMPLGQPPTPGGLQGPFGDQQQPNASQYSQFGPPNMQIQAAQMASQSDWMEKQQQQASRMFEDQAKMIQMYQQALEQIMQYRQQSFEQAMQMRENLLKEREQNLENEKAGKDKLAQMNQIAALKDQLGNMLQMADQQGVQMLNPQMTQDLNNFLAKQKDQIKTEMTQSAQQMNRMMQPGLPPQQEQELPSVREHVQIPKPGPQPQGNFNFSPPADEGDLDLQKQVDDLAAQIAAGGADQQQRRLTSADERRLAGHALGPAPQTPLQQQMPPPPMQEYERNLDFDKSLSSESKMVKVPNQGLLAMAAQAAQAQHDQGQPPAQQPTDLLTETWNEASAQKALANAGLNQSPDHKPPRTPFSGQLNLNMDNQQQMTTPKRLGGIFQPRSPSISKTGMPQPIQELPQEEEKPQNNYDGMRNTKDAYFTKTIFHEKKSEYDLNNRDMLSGTSSPTRGQFVSIEARAEMDQIEKLVQQQTQSAWAERKATMTGTSFYDNHRRTMRMQEQTQQEEMQRQLKRILDGTSTSAGNEDDPLKAMQEAYGPEMAPRDLTTQHSNTMKIRASTDNLIQEPFGVKKEEEQKPVENINQTSSRNPLANTNFALPNATQQSSLSEINIAASDQSANLRQMQAVGDKARAQENETKGIYQSNDPHNVSGFTEPSQRPSERTKWNREEPQPVPITENTVWDDPDLVPVPVMPDFTEQSIIDPNQQQFIRDGNALSPLSPPPDQTIVGLKNMDPELIKTKEFTNQEAQEIKDETVGMSEFDHQFPKQQFQTYRQSEPVSYDPSMPPQTFNHQSQSVIPTQIDVSQPNLRIGEEIKTGLSKQQAKEMNDIKDIMRRAAHVAEISDSTQKELALKRAMRGGETGESWHKPPAIKPASNAISTPSAPKTGKQALIGLGLESEKMQTAAANVAPHRLGQMQRAAQEIDQTSPNPKQNNDQQILTDLDRIIANLEMQQKNMATFGVNTPLPEDPVGEDNASDGQRRPGANDGNSINIATPVTKNYGAQGRPESGKAPIDPRSAVRSVMTTQTAAMQQPGGQPPVGAFLRPVSGKSNQSRHTVATKAMNRNGSNMMLPAQDDDQGSNHGFRQTVGQMTVAYADGNHQSSKKLAYNVDQDDELMATTGKKNPAMGSRGPIHPALSESGRTQMTAVERSHQVNIAEESQDGQNQQI